MMDNLRIKLVAPRVVCLLALASVPAQAFADGVEEGEYSLEGSYLTGAKVLASAPTDRARTGVVASWILDMSGVALTTLGFFTFPDEDAARAAVFSGCGLLAAGSVTGSISLSLREDAYREAGFRPARAYSVAGWTMTSATLVGYANMFVPYDSPEKNAIFISSLAVLPVVEMLNAAFVRPFWNRALMKSARKTPIISPLVSIAKEPVSDKSMPIFGIKGVL